MVVTSHREALKAIRGFDHLMTYLRDELGWPIDHDSLEDVERLFFDYTPEELGIDPANAAKIQTVRRLRPLSTRQPWGIFFIEFEPKRLPVVALRRILNQVALKKRASANSAERAAWSTDDLLFVSNYGDGAERQISLAHFTPNVPGNGQPSLKVLGWDNLDTPMHLDHAAEQLSRLAWPADDADVTEWRTQWRAVFTLGHREVITTSRQLSTRLAQLARAIRDRINTILVIETEEGVFAKLMKAFQEAFVYDLDEDGFADMYAQTIAYGLLSARVTNLTGAPASSSAVPITNPFLKELMETFLDVGGSNGSAGRGEGLDFDELGVSEIEDLLDDANMEAVVRDFGDQNPQEDPVIHFYELFLQEYDAKKRLQRGVFYTPRPVVSYIVQSVDETLRTEFELEDGLADTTTWGEIAARHDDIEIPEGTSPNSAFVQILDPATGTGTFLVEVIALIYQTMTEKWQREGRMELELPGLWNKYVPRHLLPRLHGYELMMAPYAIAHLKMGLKLLETGYRFGSDERLHVYLTDAFEPPRAQLDLVGFFSALAHETQAVNEVKRHQRFTVVIGNPPYLGSAKRGNEWISKLMRGRDTQTGRKTESYFEVDGEPLGERNPKFLNDDYVKFIRLSNWLIESTEIGLVALITNHGFIDNKTFRGMRQSLCQTFSEIRLLDLHGNLRKGEMAEDGSIDENVFDIQQGVAISLMWKALASTDSCNVRAADLFGDRSSKFNKLSNSSRRCFSFMDVRARTPEFLFKAQDEGFRYEYERGQLASTVFPLSVNGMKTHRDTFAIAFDKAVMRERIWEMRATSTDDNQFREKYGLRDNRDWQLARAREELRGLEAWEDGLIQCYFRPFDWRACYLSKLVMDFPRAHLGTHVANRENRVLLLMRQMQDPGDYSHVLVCDTPPIDRVFACSRGAASAFPLYLYADDTTPGQSSTQKTNIDEGFVASLAARLGLEWTSNRYSNSRMHINPDNFLAYVYGQLHSVVYRERYREFLSREFPRIFQTGNRDLFFTLADYGQELMSLHLLKSGRLGEYSTTLVGSGNFQVEKVSYSDEVVWVDKAKNHGFKGVTEEVWQFRIGGYQICEKWLKDRQAKVGKNAQAGRILTDQDIHHYQQIVVALGETIRIMAEIDEVIDAHGGWPDAFRTA